jgi:hypothetical protein
MRAGPPIVARLDNVESSAGGLNDDAVDARRPPHPALASSCRQFTPVCRIPGSDIRKDGVFP